MAFKDENSIKEFKGDNFFLSNFYEHPIEYKGILYRSTENAYVSAKSNDPKFKLKVSQVGPGQSKRFGRSVDLIENWDMVKFDVMEDILRIKFSDDFLKSKLISTDGQELYEGNWWHDTVWGVDHITGIGQNNLGKLLMKIRNEFKFKSII